VSAPLAATDRFCALFNTRPVNDLPTSPGIYFFLFFNLLLASAGILAWEKWNWTFPKAKHHICYKDLMFPEKTDPAAAKK